MTFSKTTLIPLFSTLIHTYFSLIQVNFRPFSSDFLHILSVNPESFYYIKYTYLFKKFENFRKIEKCVLSIPFLFFEDFLFKPFFKVT